jgi:hypothetical protein
MTEQLEIGLRSPLALGDRSPRAEELSPLKNFTKQRSEDCDWEHLL